MESLIIFIIIGIISALFNKDKKKPEQKPSKQQMPSFGQQTVPEKSKPVQQKQRPAVKSLEDFANEIFGQLNEKVEQEKPQQSRQRQTIPVTQTVETAREVAIEHAKAAERRSERPPLGERPLTKKLTEQSLSYTPKSRVDLVRGMVMAEVLGPPKAKRK